ncbi:MAG TPA: hypothetical protein PK555_11325, partial [Steroidobacteraceae bacterium]|nr:hypothetical protein [Steroidobacteraceae bacterium]
ARWGLAIRDSRIMASVEMRLTQHPRGLRGVSARLIRPGAALAKLSIVLYKALGKGDTGAGI